MKLHQEGTQLIIKELKPLHRSTQKEKANRNKMETPQKARKEQTFPPFDHKEKYMDTKLIVGMFHSGINKR